MERHPLPMDDVELICSVGELAVEVVAGLDGGVEEAALQVRLRKPKPRKEQRIEAETKVAETETGRIGHDGFLTGGSG